MTDPNPRAVRFRRHVEQALDRTDDPEVRYHPRQALQFLES